MGQIQGELTHRNQHLHPTIIHEQASSRNTDQIQGALTRCNPQSSPLLRLPAELRNRIYELVIRGDKISFRCWDELCIKEPALRHVCRQTRTEIGPNMLFTLSTFRGCIECMFDAANMVRYPGLQCVRSVEANMYRWVDDVTVYQFLKPLMPLQHLERVVLYRSVPVDEIEKDKVVDMVKRTLKERHNTTQPVDVVIRFSGQDVYAVA